VIDAFAASAQWCDYVRLSAPSREPCFSVGDWSTSVITRRHLLVGAATAAAAVFRRGAPPLNAAASQPATPVKFDVPPGACDCHTHIFGDPARFPFTAGRAYTPESASVEEMRALHRALHTDRVVIVQPSVYGTDNACTLDAIRQLGSRARGVAVVDAQTSAASLDQMGRAGVRGVRINLETAGVTDLTIARQRFQAAVDLVKGRGWHIQLNTRLSVVEGINDVFMASPVVVVIDHFARAQARSGVAQPGFGVVLDLVRAGRAYVKISAPYNISAMAPDYPDVAPLAKALIAANPQRILWGTNWPHPPDVSQRAGRDPNQVSPLRATDDGRVFNLLADWAPDPAVRRAILVENPARLYDF
jgi:predicted TIM-barrel fold metal-dependent hydrolase